MTTGVSHVSTAYPPSIAPSILERLKQLAILVAKVFIQILFPLISTILVAPFVPPIVTGIVAVGTVFLSSLLFQEGAVERPRSRLRGLPEQTLPSDAPCGLINDGNTCWLNATIQLLRFFLPDLLAVDCPSSLKSLQTLLEMYKESPPGAVSHASSREIWKSLLGAGLHERLGDQEDPCTGLRVIFGLLPPRARIGQEDTNVYEEPEGAPPIREGTRQTQSSYTVPLIQLPIVGPSPNIPAMLEAHLVDRGGHAPIRLDALPEGTYLYPKVEQRITFRRLPPDLFISVNRREFVRPDPTKPGKFQKNETDIEFPETLRLPVQEEEHTREESFHLEGMISHLGGQGGGHYIAFVRGENGNFYRCNDEEISQITQEEWNVAIKQGYIAYYKKIEAPIAPEEAAAGAGAPPSAEAAHA